MRISKTFFRYLGYVILIVVLYVFQGAPMIVPEIFGGRPLLLVPLALCIASCENTVVSIVFGAVCGVLTDISCDGTVGWFAFALTLICCFENFIFSRYFVPSFLTVMIFSFAAVTATILLYYVFFVLFAGVESGGILFVNHYISRTLYTFAVTIPIYFLTVFLKRNLY